MQEIPPDEENQKPKFGDEFEEIIIDFSSLSETDQPEPTDEFRRLEGQERSAANDIVETVERINSAAEASFKASRGDLFFHLGEEISTDSDGTVNLVRDFLGSDSYTLKNGESEQDLSVVDGEFYGPTTESLEDLKDFKDTALAIQQGKIKGSHTFTAIKSFIPESDSKGEDVNLFTEITRQSDGQGSVTTHLELTLQRTPSNSDSTIRQSLKIENDPNTGKIRSKSELNSHTFMGFMVLDDPVPELTASSMQEKFNPDFPVNRDLTMSEWQDLVNKPFDTAHLMQED